MPHLLNQSLVASLPRHANQLMTAHLGTFQWNLYFFVESLYGLRTFFSPRAFEVNEIGEFQKIGAQGTFTSLIL